MKRILLIFPFCLTTLLSAQTPDINTLIEKYNLCNAAISISVSPTTTDTLLFGYNERMSLTPASLTKLFTTAAILDVFDPEHRFKTDVGYSGKISGRGILNGDIIIVGGGDPVLGSPSFTNHYEDFLDTWSTAVKDYGIHAVKGNIVVLDTLFKAPHINAKWLWEDIGNHWGPGVWSVSLNDNFYSIDLKTGEEGTIPFVKKMYPDVPWLSLQNNLIASGTSDKGYIFYGPDATTAVLEGTVPVHQENFILKGATPNVPLVMATIFKIQLFFNGVGIEDADRIVLSKADPKMEFTLIHSESSPTIGELITVLNMESKNLIAETFLRHYGLANGSTSSYQESARLMMSLFDSLGITKGDLFLEDGSGVSPQNSFSAIAVTNLLNYMSNSKNADLFRNSLPEGGVSGTLKSRFSDPIFKGRVRAKTGGSTRVRGLAGYLKSNSGKNFSFAIIVNNYAGTNQSVNLFMEELLQELILIY